jgi:hypothetical protein
MSSIDLALRVGHPRQLDPAENDDLCHLDIDFHQSQACNSSL